MNFARRQDVSRATAILGDVAEAVSGAAGWHGWLWSIRLAQARAELALAQANHDDAVDWARQSIEQSRARRRVKYVVLGMTTRAQALMGLGRTKDAITELNAALAAARPIADPALRLRPLVELLSLDGDHALAAEAGAALECMTAGMPPDVRRRFDTAEQVRRAAKLARWAPTDDGFT